MPPSYEIPITWHVLRAGARVEKGRLKSAPSSVSVGLSFVNPLNYSHSFSYSELHLIYIDIIKYHIVYRLKDHLSL